MDSLGEIFMTNQSGIRRKSSKHLSDDVLADYVYGRASATQRETVQRHLADCDTCLKEFQFTCLLASTLSKEALLGNDRQALKNFWQQVAANTTVVAQPTAAQGKTGRRRRT
jgi:hypothetical protein